jgi:hypothetical protein
MMDRPKFLNVVALCGLVGLTLAQEPKVVNGGRKKAHVLVLGTFHMANPGHGIFNLKVDDVLTPKRQKEIGETVEVMKHFHPTKIASPEERILVIYGSGHLYWLQRNVMDSADLELDRFEDCVGQATE